MSWTRVIPTTNHRRCVLSFRDAKRRSWIRNCSNTVSVQSGQRPPVSPQVPWTQSVLTNNTVVICTTKCSEIVLAEASVLKSYPWKAKQTISFKEEQHCILPGIKSTKTHWQSHWWSASGSGNRWSLTLSIDHEAIAIMSWSWSYYKLAIMRSQFLFLWVLPNDPVGGTSWILIEHRRRGVGPSIRHSNGPTATECGLTTFDHVYGGCECGQWITPRLRLRVLFLLGYDSVWLVHRGSKRWKSLISFSSTGGWCC